MLIFQPWKLSILLDHILHWTFTWMSVHSKYTLTRFHSILDCYYIRSLTKSAQTDTSIQLVPKSLKPAEVHFATMTYCDRQKNSQHENRISEAGKHSVKKGTLYRSFKIWHQSSILKCSESLKIIRKTGYQLQSIIWGNNPFKTCQV